MWACVQSVTLDRMLLESEAASKVHPAVLRLGLKYADGGITGGNARCLAMLAAFCSVIEVSGAAASRCPLAQCYAICLRKSSCFVGALLCRLAVLFPEPICKCRLSWHQCSVRISMDVCSASTLFTRLGIRRPIFHPCSSVSFM